MDKRFAVWTAAAATLFNFGAISIARGADPDRETTTQQELLDELATLKAKVRELEQRQSGEWQKQQTANVDATVERVLRDADQRSRMLQMEGFTAGHSKDKFLIQSADGAFVLHPWLQFQFRNVTNYREDAGDGDSDLQNGFEVRRMKFGFDGNAFGKELTYLFLWGTDRKSGNVNLEEAWARYQFADEWAVRGGQLKDPFAHESLVSSKRLLAAERTLLTDNFTGGDNFVQGVTLLYDNGKQPFRGEVAFHDGARNNFNQNFQDFPTNNANFGFAGRADFKVFGDWKPYDDFTALDTKDNLLVIGAGVDWTEAGDTDILLHTADVQYESPNGLGLYGAYYGRYTQNAPAGTAATTSDTYDWGIIAQASYLITESKWEPFARYSLINFDADTVADDTENVVHEITGGVNYYLHGHQAKFTLDFTYLPNGSPVNDDGAGILATEDGSDEFILRAQFQLLL